METQILGKNKKELYALAKEYKIPGRSYMDIADLQDALWDHLYAEKPPSTLSQALDYLLLHPDPLVQEIHKAWMIYGPDRIAGALEEVAFAYEGIKLDEKETRLMDSPQAFRQTIGIVGSWATRLSFDLSNVGIEVEDLDDD